MTATKNAGMTSVAAGRYRLHGLKLSYFTGKLEAYMRAKGLEYDFVPMDLADFRACARATGIAQMPQLQTPEGDWLTDTTSIIAHLEAGEPGPSFLPGDREADFLSLFLEDAFDEMLWRPALYYRWAFAEDAQLMSGQIARTLLRDLPLPFFLRQAFIRQRQKRTFLTRDGVTRATAPAIEGLFHAVVDSLEPVLATRPYLFGARPCAADFGLFGSVFRHFSIDPTPAAILRDKAPNLLAWSARLWAAQPSFLEAVPSLQSAPVDLDPVLSLAGAEHLVYLGRNEDALLAGARQVVWISQGVEFRAPVAPYRAVCLNALRARYQELDEASRQRVAGRIGFNVDVLAAPASNLTIPAGGRPVDRLWSSA